MEDISIIELYFARDEQAITETDKKYGKFCYGIAKNLVASVQDAEECVNDTYIKTWNSIPPNRPDSLMAWLGRIVRNISLSHIRKRNAQKRGGGDILLGELEECIPAKSNIYEELEVKELAASINKWLSKQNEFNRILFVKRYWNGESLAALALESGLAKNTLSQRLKRLRGSLKEHLEREEVMV